MLTNTFNKVHNDLSVAPSQETDKQISFLDLLITCNSSSLEIDITENPQPQTQPYITYPVIPWNTEWPPTIIS
jgi:hypothetical protein